MFEFFDRSENIFQFKLYFFSTDSKLTQLDFSIPKAPVSVQVQSGFRKVEPSSKRKENTGFISKGTSITQSNAIVR